MAYILAVNPAFLAQAGIDRGAALTATAVGSALFTAVMALYANVPFGLAPGMGMNAFFTYVLCLGLKLPWQAALGVVFLSGLLFLAVSLTGLRKKIIESIPLSLRAAIGCGIGFFIAFIGLKESGLIVADPNMLVALGNFTAPPVLLAIAGFLLVAVLVRNNVPGAILIALFLLTLAGAWIPGADGQPLTAWPHHLFSAPPSLAPAFGKLDLAYPFAHFGQIAAALFALFFVNLFDGLGTLVGLLDRTGLLEHHTKGQEQPRHEKALRADALATMGCAVLGSSTVTPYIESAAGIEQGGRTGLTALVTAACFVLALFAAPLLLVIPAVATAPILVLVGIRMMDGIGRLDLHDLADGIPAILIILLMPLTFSISEGIAIGFIAWSALRILLGRWRELSPTMWGMTALLVVHYVWRGR